jgi:hypothetical protein
MTKKVLKVRGNPSPKPSQKFRETVLKICKNHNVSKSWVCREIPMHPSLFWKYLSGDVSKPGKVKFQKLAALETKLKRNADRRRQRANVRTSIRNLV